MRKFTFVYVLLILSLPVYAQIVNIEALRINAQDKKLSGLFDLNFSMRKNKAGQTIVTGTDIGARLNLNDRNNLTFLSGYHLTQFNDSDDPTAPSKNYNNQAFGHLRYNYQFNEGISLEAFSQAQWDEVQEIDLRLLTGLGARFRLFQNDTTSFFFGLSFMHEYEETSEQAENIIINRHQRLNTYISGQLGLNPFLAFHYVLYFQPRPSELGDFRLSSNIQLIIRLTGKVNFTSSASLLFDSRPPATVPKTQYYLSNGIQVAF